MKPMQMNGKFWGISHVCSCIVWVGSSSWFMQKFHISNRWTQQFCLVNSSADPMINPTTNQPTSPGDTVTSGQGNPHRLLTLDSTNFTWAMRAYPRLGALGRNGWGQPVEGMGSPKPNGSTPWKMNGWNLQPSSMKRKENDRNQTSMRTCSMLIFHDV